MKRSEPDDSRAHIQNHLKSHRISKGLSQGALASLAGVTRQAIYAIETDQYLPTTGVALRLAQALECRVEDLFALTAGGEVLDGELVGKMPAGLSGPSGKSLPLRVKVARVGDRLLVRPVSSLGDVLNYTVGADGLLMPGSGRSSGQKDRVRVQLLRDRRSVEEEIVVAGCDPAVFLLGEHLRRRQNQATVVGWPMGSGAAIEALRRREVHVAGLHLVDVKSGECNLPYLRRHLKGEEVTVVTFAVWEQGLMVQHGNPKAIREIGDLARKGVRIVNREEGSGARVLLDRKLADAGIKGSQVPGYGQVAASHLEVARLIAQGQADAGIGVRSAARLLGLDFLPVQEERYDLVIPSPYLTTHPGLSHLLDTIVSRSFRSEIEALGGYDTRDTGKVIPLTGPAT